MRLPMWPTEIEIEETPCRASCVSTTSRIGRSVNGIRGLGSTAVYGASRLPRPPAMMTACSARSDGIGAAATDHRRPGHPLDHGQQPVAQVGPRLPVRGGTQLRGVPQQLMDLAVD